MSLSWTYEGDIISLLVKFGLNKINIYFLNDNDEFEFKLDLD